MITIQEDYVKKHLQSGLKIGDRVKVIRIAKDHEAGWDFVWVENMNCTVNKIGKIIPIGNYIVDRPGKGFRIEFEDKTLHSSCYPYFVLQKIRPIINDF